MPRARLGSQGWIEPPRRVRVPVLDGVFEYIMRFFVSEDFDGGRPECDIYKTKFHVE
jgi:hypothetical protein